jgi:dipeptidyl aminopeptidase/acylaminoacyl peptidase
MQRQTFSLNLDGGRLQGIMHSPDDNLLGEKVLPVVIMGNGYATEWQFGTADYIEAFTNAGFIVVNFDYRGFGSSGNQEGQPRQVVDIPAQLDDWRAVVEYCLQQSFCDATQLVLWGSSLGGGHALSIASEMPQLAAVVVQVPHCDSRAAFKTISLGAVLIGMTCAIYDAVRAKLNLSAFCIPILGEPNSYAVMNHPAWQKQYQQLVNSSRTWENKIPARSLLLGGDYRPISKAHKISCPCLLVAGKQDAGVPIQSVHKTAAKIPQASVFAYQGDHFEVYQGEQSAAIIKIELAFMQQHLVKLYD